MLNLGDGISIALRKLLLGVRRGSQAILVQSSRSVISDSL